jgi:putative copper export protein
MSDWAVSSATSHASLQRTDQIRQRSRTKALLTGSAFFWIYGMLFMFVFQRSMPKMKTQEAQAVRRFSDSKASL